MTGEPTGEPRQFRYASRRIGLFVLLALAVFVAAILQAGVLRRVDVGLSSPRSTPAWRMAATKTASASSTNRPMRRLA